MLTFNKWLADKAEEFSSKTYLIDSSTQITYAENFIKIKMLMHKLQKQILPGQYIIFLGTGSIASYQLYFATIALQAIWVPIIWKAEPETLQSVIQQLNPALIIYDTLGSETLEKLEIAQLPRRLELMEIFSSLNEEELFYPLEEKNEDRIISAYLTSGSTAAAKLVTHTWEATFHHAGATVERYGLNTPTLFNPREIAHVSGAFPKTTIMECGGSIVIPNADSNKKTEESRLRDWATLIVEKNVTHISFFPIEMRAYARLVTQDPHLQPSRLQRITTGGEGVELSDLIEIARAFTVNRMLYDYLWMLYPYLGDGIIFNFLKQLYEQFYGHLVQVTQTYGATELICNAVANTPMSGPDTRGIGSPIRGIYAEIIDENGIPLKCDGKNIGRLQFFGNSIAQSYIGQNNNTNTLTRHYHLTNDLACIAPNGYITLFGRINNLIKLPDEKNLINPTVLEREIKKINGIDIIVVFSHENKLHAAMNILPSANEKTIISALKSNNALTLITTISFCNDPPLTEGGKVDRNKLIDKVKNGDYLVKKVERQESSSSMNKFRFCTIS